MSTQAYRRRRLRPCPTDQELAAMVERIREEHARRTPDEARAATEKALRHWRKADGRLRVFDPGRVAS